GPSSRSGSMRVVEAVSSDATSGRTRLFLILPITDLGLPPTAFLRFARRPSFGTRGRGRCPSKNVEENARHANGETGGPLPVRRASGGLGVREEGLYAPRAGVRRDRRCPRLERRPPPGRKTGAGEPGRARLAAAPAGRGRRPQAHPQRPDVRRGP